MKSIVCDSPTPDATCVRSVSRDGQPYRAYVTIERRSASRASEESKSEHDRKDGEWKISVMDLRRAYVWSEIELTLFSLRITACGRRSANVARQTACYLPPSYSVRSAVIGSTLLARLAGR